MMREIVLIDEWGVVGSVNWWMMREIPVVVVGIVNNWNDEREVMDDERENDEREVIYELIDEWWERFQL